MVSPTFAYRRASRRHLRPVKSSLFPIAKPTLFGGDIDLLRTHTCGELRLDHVGQQVTLCGWVDTYRDHSGVLFVDLRDRYGKTQVVFAPESGDETLQASKTLRSEYVVLVRGKVARRPEGTVNPKLDTGQIELRAQHMEMLNRSLNPPFQPTGKELPGEDIRLKYRYIDLRRPEMQRTMLLRHRMIKIMRDYCDALGFIDVETPMLGRSTPEGARDYLVPSRVQQGSYYALPQSPQLYKQILMVAGYDRYIQVARCFRDEDLRADRQPEFTQLDLEMSFITADDIIGVIDGLVARLAKEILGLDVPLPLPRMSYDEAMERFGHDAPDLRFGMEIVDITDAGQGVGVQGVSRRGRGGRARPRHQRQGRRRPLFAQGHRRADRLRGRELRREGARLVQGRGRRPVWPRRSPRTSSADLLAKIGQTMDAAAGDLLLIVADKFETTCKALYALRKRLGAELKLYDPATMNFSWVVEFPMFAFDTEENCWTAMHHPFTAPRPQDRELLRHRSAEVPRPGLRPGDQRLRGGRRHDPYPRPATSAGGVRAVGHRRADGPRAIRLPAGRPAIWRPAPRRHRPGHRPHGDALCRAGQHPRLHRLPEDPARHRHDDRRPGPGRRQATARVGHQAGRLTKPTCWGGADMLGRH